ncbi:MAG: hypothetical protein HC898_06090 [Phycisphaerales bacterium]|nr:hypothetical protein [Phycisphaerales bacterium]
MEREVHPFPTTQWSMVRVAGQEGHTGHRKALEDFLRKYLPALRMHLLLDRHIQEEEVEDLLQGFVTDKVIQDKILNQANQAKGRLRTFLLAVLGNYVSQQYRHDHAKLRSPTQPMASLSECIDHYDRAPQPADAFDATWAREVIYATIREMQLYCERTQRTDIWVLFDARILGPLIRNEPPVPYAELVQRCQLTSPSEASNLVISGKRIFTRVLHAVVGEYAGDPHNVEEEIINLKEILSR